MDIPSKWKLRWFLQGMASVFGYKIDAEREIDACVEEMMRSRGDATQS